MTGDDLARALRLKVWKFNLVPPRGTDRARVIVWVEEWNKGAGAPVKHTLAKMEGAWGTGEIPMLLYVPDGPGKVVISIGPTSVYQDVPPSLAAVKPSSFSVAGETALELGKDVTLAKLEYAAPHGRGGTSMDPSEVLPSNDLTFIFKMRWDRDEQSSTSGLHEAFPSVLRISESRHTTDGGRTFFGSQRVSYACFTPTRSSSLPATKSTTSPTVVGFR